MVTATTDLISAGRLTHLQRLEAESIQIFREAVSESEKPVMLYSVGKDSSVHAAPGGEGLLPVGAAVPAAPRRHDVEVPGDVRVPRPDGRPSRHGAARPPEPRVRREGHQPVRPRLGDAHRHVEDRGAQAGPRRTSSTSASAAPAATRRSPGPRSGSSRSARPSTGGTRSASAPSCGGSTTPAAARRERAGVPAVELDRARRVAVHPPRADPDRAALLRGAPPGRRARRHADHGRRRPHAGRARRGAEMQSVRFRTLGCYPLTGAIESTPTRSPTSSRRCS